MELSKIEQLLEAYFEGETSLEQEKQLRAYFSSMEVAPHLQIYVPMFTAFAEAKEEKFDRVIQLPEERISLRWIPVAASILLCVGLFLTFNDKLGGHDYGTYEDPEVAALKTKQAFMMMGNFMSQGTSELDAIGEFEKTTEKYLK